VLGLAVVCLRAGAGPRADAAGRALLALVAATYAALAATLRRGAAPTCHGICTADFVLNLALEFLPCLLGFFLLRPSSELASPRANARDSLNAQARLEARYQAV